MQHGGMANNRKSLVVAALVALCAGGLTVATAPQAHAVTYTSGVNACGSLYPRGTTSGYSLILVTVAGVSSQQTFPYPGGTVNAIGSSHSGTVVSYADTRITRWGFTGCSQQ